MITTHFEPTYARKALPLLDEPCFKAKFNLKVTAPAEWSVLSNMPGTATTSDSLTTTLFQTTPAMPCYLLHWTLHKHRRLSTFLGPTEISLYAADTSYSQDFLQLATETLDYYNGFFGLPYSLPKLDLISVFSNL